MVRKKLLVLWVTQFLLVLVWALTLIVLAVGLRTADATICALFGASCGFIFSLNGVFIRSLNTIYRQKILYEEIRYEMIRERIPNSHKVLLLIQYRDLIYFNGVPLPDQEVRVERDGYLGLTSLQDHRVHWYPIIVISLTRYKGGRLQVGFLDQDE